MIKWGEFRDDDLLFEAFLPEHERQPQDWLLRTSRRGHIIEERRIELVWPPRFGPDSGDVATLERALDAAMAMARTLAPMESAGAYRAGASESVDPDPYVHAVLHGLLTEYVAAEAALGITPEQTAAHLGLDVGLQAGGLFPMAITPRRDARMRKVTLLAGLARSDRRVSGRIPELVAALIREDVPAIKLVLEQCGVEPERPTR